MIKREIVCHGDGLLLENIQVPILEINYSVRDTMPELLEIKAKELGITVEQLVKRFITAGMSEFYVGVEPYFEATTLDEFKVFNEVFKPQ